MKNSYRGIRVSSENIQLSHSVFVCVNPITDSGISAPIDGNFNVVSAEMDIGVTYVEASGVQVHFSPTSLSTVSFPNPVLSGRLLHLTGIGIILSAEIFDEAGRIVHRDYGNVNSPLLNISTQGFSSGVYNAVLYDNNGKESRVRFVVE